MEENNGNGLLDFPALIPKITQALQAMEAEGRIQAIREQALRELLQ